MSNLLHAIMQIKNCTPAVAEEYQRELVQAVRDGEDPEEALYDFGLEPDFVMDLIYLL